MPSKDDIQIQVAWWRERRPEGVSEVDFEQALRKAELALKDAEQDPEDPEPAREAARALEKVADESRETSRALRSPDHAKLREELARLEAYARRDAQRLQAAADEAVARDEEAPETPESRLADPKHLRRMVRQLPFKGPMIFGFAASPEDEECQLFIRPRGTARRLMDLARGVPGDGRPCCGQVFMLREEPRLLIVSVESTLPPNLARCLRRFLRRIKLRRVKKVLILREGEAVDASEDDEDAAVEGMDAVAVAAFHGGLTRQAPSTWSDKSSRIKAALMAWRIARAQTEHEVAQMTGTTSTLRLEEAEASRLAQALAKRDEQFRRAARHWSESMDPSPQSASAKALRQAAKGYLSFVTTDKALQRVDQVVVPETSMRIPLVKALEQILKALA